jgi:tetratricopeptide (TPR) repeat protein
MNRRARTSLAASARAGVWVLLAAVGTTLPACSSGVPSFSQADPFERLRLLAERPGGTDSTIPPPDPALAEIAPDDPDATRARVPLADLDPESIASAPASETDGAPAPETADSPEAEPTDEARTEALMLYARARQMLAGGEANEAITLLDRASELDPTAPEIWRALGDARRAARFENSAGLAYQRAAELGLAEPEALTLAGLHALGRGETAAAARWLLSATRADPRHADPLIDFIAHGALGEALLDLGWTEAGAEAIEIGIGIPRVARVPTNLGREAADLQRKRGPLLATLGDALLRLGRYAEAADAYERARATPGSAGVQERLIYALRRSGNDAGAALVLLDEIREGGRLTPGVVRSLGDLAQRIRPRTAVADALGAIDDEGSPTRRADLVIARASTLPDDRALALLASELAGDAGESAPSRLALLIAGIERAAGDALSGETDTLDPERGGEASLAWVESVVGTTPSLAGDAAFALTRARGLPAGLAARVQESIDDADARVLLLAELALLHDDRDAVGASLAALPTPGEGVPASTLALRARLAAALGERGAMDEAIAALRSTDARDDLAFALRTAQRFDESLAVLRDLAKQSPGAESPPGIGVDALLELAGMETLAGDPADAKIALERALDADPRDERVYAALLALHSPGGALPDEEAVAALGRRMREIMPTSDLLQTMLAGELLRRGLIDDAAAVIVPLFEAAPTEPSRLDAMLNLWRRRAIAQRTDANEIDLAQRIAGEHPNAPGPVRLLAGGLVLADDPDGAIAAIDRYEQATGDRSLAGLREQLIRDAIRDHERADALALARLDHTPRSIDETIALATVHAGMITRGADLAEAIPAIRDALASLPDDAGLTEAQRSAAQNAVTRAAIAVDQVPATGRESRPLLDPRASGAMLSLLDFAQGRGLVVSPGVHELRLILLSKAGAGPDRLIAAAEHAIAQSLAQPNASPSIERAFLRRAADLLVDAGEADRAFDWLATRALAGAADEPALNSDAFQEWFRLVVIAEDADRGRAFIDRLNAAGLVQPAWGEIRPEGWDGRGAGDPAEIAYLLGVFTQGDEEADRVRRDYLRLALVYDPTHPWAANDLGYTMLEAGEDLAEAERLIEIAYEGAPDRANIVDSLGWVRYHRGKLEDATDPATGAVEPGAVTLLRRAVELSDPEDDGVVHDHLGDALYASGRTDEAIEAWRTAARLANQALSRLRASGRADGVRSGELSDLAVRAIMKPNAIQMGQAPEIAPQKGTTNSTPSPDEDG